MATGPCSNMGREGEGGKWAEREGRERVGAGMRRGGESEGERARESGGKRGRAGQSDQERASPGDEYEVEMGGDVGRKEDGEMESERERECVCVCESERVSE